MARLFSLADAGAVDDPEFGHFEPGADGSFDFPDELSDKLHRLHHRRRPAWETETERLDRMHGEDLSRRRDPAALYDAVGEFSGALKQFATAAVPPDAAAEIAELRRQLAELRAAQVPAETIPADGSPALADDAAPAKSPSRKAPA
jgi:hypothetical protein